MPDPEVYTPESTGLRITVDELRELHGISGIMNGVSDEALLAFARVTELVHVPGGELIMARGQRCGCGYTVIHGRVRGVRCDSTGGLETVGELGRGDSIGFMFLIGDEASSGDAYTMRNCTLLRIPREATKEVCFAYPDLLLALARALSRALARTARFAFGGAEEASRAVVNVAVLPCGAHPSVQLATDSLVEAASASMTAAKLTAADAEAALGGGVMEVGADRLIGWFHEQEAQRDLVLFECDRRHTAWTEVCMRQADRILMVAAAGEASPPHESLTVMRESAKGPTPDLDLLLLHDAGVELPSNTRAWLDSGDFARHNHARVDRKADFERVVRRLTGRAVGVVLGGGGARGIAHIGVLQAIQEAGVPIDYIGGASMGSIFAGGWARGWSPEQMLERVRQVFAPKRALSDITFPFVALMRGSKLKRVLRSLYEELECEDFWTPFFCASTNLTNAGVVVHQRGPVWKAIRASASMPGIFPPMHEGGQLLVDGGVLDNLPVQIASQLCDGGPVIAVDVSESSLSDVDKSYVSSVSGWRLLARKLNPFVRSPQIPSLLELITQSTLVASRQSQEVAAAQAALYLKPPVNDFGTMQFDAHEELYRAGYEYACEMMSDWPWPPPEDVVPKV